MGRLQYGCLFATERGLPILLVTDGDISQRFIAALPKFQPLDRITPTWTPDYA